MRPQRLATRQLGRRCDAAISHDGISIASAADATSRIASGADAFAAPVFLFDYVTSMADFMALFCRKMYEHQG